VPNQGRGHLNFSQ